jgi:stress response protein SCP2
VAPEPLDPVYRVIDKLDLAIIKLADVSSDIKQILAVHETRLDQTDNIIERSFIQVDAVHNRVSNLRDDMNRESMNIRDEIAKINQWRWQVIGASSVMAAIITYIMSNIPM